MIIFFGTRMYGKTDQVPGLFHLGTQFFHAQFVPLFPVRSYLVFHGTDRGIPLCLSGKSVFFGYLRTALLRCGTGGLITAIVLGAEYLDRHKAALADTLIALAVGVVCLVLFFLSYRLSRPSPLRAYRLASKAGLRLDLLAEHYAKRLTPEQLDELARQVRPEDETTTPDESPPEYSNH